MNKKKFNSIDIFKLLMAVCVVAIHTHPLENCKNELANNVYNSTVSMAVPFFFIAAGFLLAQKLEYPFLGEKNELIIKKYLIKIVKLYVFWNIAYLPMTIYHFVDSKMSMKMIIYKYLKGLFIIGEQYNSWPLWYLLASIYALAIILLLIKFKQTPKRIVVVGCIAFVASVAIAYCWSYTGEVPKVFSMIQKIVRETLNNGRILYGLFYIPIGMIMAKKRFRNILVLSMLILGFVANSIISNEEISIVLTGISSIGLFGSVLLINLPDLAVFPFVRKMSTVVYFIHMYVYVLFYMIVYGKQVYGLESFLGTALITTLIAAIYVFCKNYVDKMRINKN